MGKDIFISYSRKDRDLVFPLVERINRELNTHCWLDMKGIESGGDFEEVIMQNIEECRIVLFMLSDASLKSKWTKREVLYAEDEGKRIVPVLINGDKLRGWFKFHFGNVDYIDIHVNEQKEKLIGNLKSWLNVNGSVVHQADNPTKMSAPQAEGPTSPAEQYELGDDYHYGLNGKPLDYVEAAKWYRKAAEQGFEMAQFNLGWMYENGSGVLQSGTEAVKWYRKAAEQGYGQAQYNLGWMYQFGSGVSQSDTEAVKWYRKAAEQGDEEAKERLEELGRLATSDRMLTVNGVSFKMIYVEGSSFQMGSDVYKEEKPVHSVKLCSYHIGETPVTQALWKAVMGNNPSLFKGDNLPVEKVSWNDCQEFIQKLNQLTGKTFRLPTEAEWEYAARGGKHHCPYKYAGSNNLNEVAWYEDNSGDVTHPVKTKKPNALGIYDMSGNVQEWCQDWYGVYCNPTQTDPTGPLDGSSRVLRGGSWGSETEFCRVYTREYTNPDFDSYLVGFRLVL